MKRWWVLLLVLGLALAMAAPATAKKPDNPGKPPPASGQKCADMDPDSWIVSSANGTDTGFDAISGTGNWLQFCIDVNDVQKGPWEILVTVAAGDSLRWVLIVPRDSVSPGDLCGEEIRERKVTGNNPYIFDMPASGFDACGEDFPDSGTQEADKAFALLVFAQAVKNSSATVTVDIVDLPPPQ